MNKYKVQVIEDEINICNFMKMIFETHEYQAIFSQGRKWSDDVLVASSGCRYFGSRIAGYGWHRGDKTDSKGFGYTDHCFVGEKQ